MRLRQYRFKFYLNAMHAFVFENKIGHIHPHTWEIVILVTNTSNHLVLFSDLEKHINDYLSKYEGKVLNAFEPFDNIQPTMENLSSFFSAHIIKLLDGTTWRLDEFLISENPARQYILYFNEEEKKGNFVALDKMDKEKDFQEENVKNVILEDDIKKQEKDKKYFLKKKERKKNLITRLASLKDYIVRITTAIYSRNEKILTTGIKTIFLLISILLFIIFLKSSTIDYVKMFENSIFFKLFGGAL